MTWLLLGVVLVALAAAVELIRRLLRDEREFERWLEELERNGDWRP